MTLTWTGGTAGWTDGAYWSAGNAPGAGDDAAFTGTAASFAWISDARAAGTVTLADPNATLSVAAGSGQDATLALSGPLALNAGTLLLGVGGTLVGTHVVAGGGHLLSAGGALDGVTWTGPLVISGLGSSLSVRDGITLLPSVAGAKAQLIVFGEADGLSFAGDQTTLDAVNISLGGGVFVSAAELTLGPTALLDVVGDVSVFTDTLTNRGVIGNTGLTGELYLYGAFVNLGQVASNRDNLVFDGPSVRNAGTLDVGASQTATFIPRIAMVGHVVPGSFANMPVGDPPYFTATANVFDNTGFVTLETGASVQVGKYTGFDAVPGAVFTNSGTIALGAKSTATLSVESFANSGSIEINAGAKLRVAFHGADQYAPASTGTFANTGVIHVDPLGTLDLVLAGAASLDSLGSIEVQGGLVLLDGGTIDNTGKTLTLGDAGLLHNVKFEGGATLRGGTVIAHSGAVVADATLDGVNWVGRLDLASGEQSYSRGATITNGFSIVPASGTGPGVINVGQSTATVFDVATIDHMVINIDTESGFNSSGLLVGKTTLGADGRINAGTGAGNLGTLPPTTYPPVDYGYALTNLGVIDVTAPNGFFSIDGTIHNAGLIEVANGATLRVYGAIDGAGTVEVLTGEIDFHQPIDTPLALRFVGPGGTMRFGTALGGVGTASHIAGFASGDRIGIDTYSDEPIDQVVYANGTLSLVSVGTVIAAIRLDGSYTGADFQLVTVDGRQYVTTSTTAAPLPAGPTITGAAAFAAVGPTTPFAAVTIADADPAAILTVTVSMSNPVYGLFSNLGATGGYSFAAGAYTATGNAAALTTALDALVFSPNGGLGAVESAGLTIAVTDPNAGATDRTTTVTTLRPPGGADPAATTVASSAAGTGFALAVAGRTNLAYVSSPTGAPVFLPHGYKGAYLGFGPATTLIDYDVGGAMLAGNQADALLYSFVDGDTLIGGAGSDTIVATGASTIDGTRSSGHNLIFGGAGTTSIAGGISDTIVGGAGATQIRTGSWRSLVVLGTGAASVASGGFDTILGGGGKLTAGGLAALVALGSGGGLVASARSTVLGGAGAATVVGQATVFAGSGSLVMFPSAGPSLVTGGTGSATIYAGPGAGGVFAGGSAGNNLIFVSALGESDRSAAFGAGDGDRLYAVAGGSGGPVALVAGAGAETLAAVPGARNVSLLAGPGHDRLFGADGDDTIYGGMGSATMTGGGGDDRFVFAPSGHGGQSVITDFDASRDLLVLAGYRTGEAGAALAGATVANGAETLTLSDGTRITLMGVAGLTSQSFG